MSTHDIPSDIRKGDFFYTIDRGFLNRRLCLAALPRPLRDDYIQHQKPGNDPMTILSNDQFLITMLLDAYQEMGVPTLLKALELSDPKRLFLSTEKLSPCEEIFEASRVDHLVELDMDFGKPVHITYHTKHLVSTTGRERLSEGAVQSILGLLHNKANRFEIEPLVIGTPLLDHHLNGNDGERTYLMFGGYSSSYGEILPEDIEQFSKMVDVTVKDADEWMNVMKKIPEKKVKQAFAELLAEPTEMDWGGESNDHFSGSLVVGGRRRTAAFLLKGPSGGRCFGKMTLDMCGKKADQVLRLTESGADISIVQHCHLIGEAVRKTLRSLTVAPGGRMSRIARKFCLIDGQSTYKILKAYNFLGRVISSGGQPKRPSRWLRES